MFSKGSRYEKIEEYDALDSKGNHNRVKKLRIAKDVRGVFQHQVNGSDRLDLIANLYYGDPKMFWLICDANFEIYPLDLLKEGKKIFIPPKP